MSGRVYWATATASNLNTIQLSGFNVVYLKETWIPEDFEIETTQPIQELWVSINLTNNSMLSYFTVAIELKLIIRYGLALNSLQLV